MSQLYCLLIRKIANSVSTYFYSLMLFICYCSNIKTEGKKICTHVIYLSFCVTFVSGNRTAFWLFIKYCLGAVNKSSLLKLDVGIRPFDLLAIQTIKVIQNSKIIHAGTKDLPPPPNLYNPSCTPFMSELRECYSISVSHRTSYILALCVFLV